jgi:hypothetical protein
MKKVLFTSLLALFVLALALATLPVSPVQAQPDPVSTPLDAGSWTAGNEIYVDLESNPAPEWLQLMGKGTKVAETGQICHPFRGAQFYWVAEIRQLVGGEWVKLPTVVDWVPSTEGQLMACAKAPSAGVYALFGYFSPPAGWVEPREEIHNIVKLD